MALNKFKVCPACGEHNPPALLECRSCETDLTGIKVVDEGIADDEAPVVPQQDQGSLVKRCDCGTENPPQSRKCASCGEDLSDVRAVMSNADKAGSPLPPVLRALDGSFSFTLTKPVTVIGREGELDSYLKEKSYVSRKHAKLTVAGGEVFIENLSTTNHTFVNHIMLSGDAPLVLKNGDEVGLGGTLINGERQALAAYFELEVNS